MKNMKKILVLSLAAVLLVAVSVGGTVAYLTAVTGEVENEFTTSNINITLTESENLNLKMVPGSTIKKDPVVTVLKGSEECWVFVEVTRSANFDDFMTYAMKDGWMLVATDGLTSVYGYNTTVDAAEENKVIAVLAGDVVSVKSSVTKAMMDAIDDGTASKPTLTFKAYAVQAANISATTASDAWVVYNNAK